jgi:Flp pilus assembly protein protease CpaA
MITVAAPTIMLLIALIEDLRTKKVRNSIIVVGFIAGLIWINFVLPGSSSGLMTVASIATAVALCFPLYYFKVIGGGDFKLMIVFALLTSTEAVVTVTWMSLFWGGLLGLFQALFSGQLKQILHNVISIISTKRSVAETKLHRIPYTVALFLAWISHLSFEMARVQPWL